MLDTRFKACQGLLAFGGLSLAKVKGGAYEPSTAPLDRESCGWRENPEVRNILGRDD